MKITGLDDTSKPDTKSPHLEDEMIKYYCDFCDRELPDSLIKSIQGNHNSNENQKLQKELDQLGQKHHKALENIEKILMNITRNPN